ncbi:MAG: response regulator transcription factor [bacterium]|nr:response regulator transcription factor [bacterium]
MEKVLVVEDDPDIARVLQLELQRAGYGVDVVRDGKTASTYDVGETALVILDLLLPGMDGVDVCRSIRERSSVPIIMLTARDTTRDTVTGLDSGATDYMTKPFDIEELLARARAHIRTNQTRQRTLGAGDLLLYRDAHEVEVGGKPLELTATEFRLLEHLLLNSNKVFTRDALMNAIWGTDFIGESNVVDVHVGHLRRKLRDAGVPETLIRTVRGVGYILRT